MPNLAKRFITAGVGIPILLVAIYWAPTWVFPFVIALAAAMASFEYYGIVAKDKERLRWVGTVGSVACVLFLSFFVTDWRVGITCAAVLPLISLLLLLFHPGEIEKVPRYAGALALGIAYTGFLPAFVGLLHQVQGIGPHLVILLLTVSFMGDTGAYFAGRFLGRHKLYPLVSPKKTWEGAVGGLGASAAGAGVVQYLFIPELPIVTVVALGAVAGAVGQCGDLCESMLKRAYGVKDSGSSLPGHGGMLDRIDATMFAAPVLYLSLLWLGLLPGLAG